MGKWCRLFTDALYDSGGSFITFDRNRTKLDGSW